MIYEVFDPTNSRHISYFKSMPCQICADTQGIVAVNKNLEVQGMVIMDSWSPNSVQVSFKLTSSMCFRPGELITIAAEHIYDFAGRGIVYALVRDSNEEALSVDRKIGYQTVAVLKDGYSVGEDLHLLSMTKEQCRFYTPKQEAA